MECLLYALKDMKVQPPNMSIIQVYYTAYTEVTYIDILATRWIYSPYASPAHSSTFEKFKYSDMPPFHSVLGLKTIGPTLGIYTRPVPMLPGVF